MQPILICFSLCLAVANAAIATTGGYYYALPTAGAPIFTATSRIQPLIQPSISQQYHTQDSFGQYSYGYSEPSSSKQEVRTLDGITRGTYSYRDAAGEIQTVEYIADAGGFRVAATNLPRQAPLVTPAAVTDTPEVAAARAEHLAAYKAVETRLQALSSPSSSLTKSTDSADTLLPRPVTDTAEVAAAKLQFFERYAEEQQRHQLLHSHQQQQQQLLRYQPVVYGYQLTAAPQRAYLPAQ